MPRKQNKTEAQYYCLKCRVKFLSAENLQLHLDWNHYDIITQQPNKKNNSVDSTDKPKK